MPYIDRTQRPIIVRHFDSGLMDNVQTEGELNYLISIIVHEWIGRKGMKYTNINSAIGVLECAKLELYRQIAAPYENKKKEENGNISKLDGEE